MLVVARTGLITALAVLFLRRRSVLPGPVASLLVIGFFAGAVRMGTLPAAELSEADAQALRTAMSGERIEVAFRVERVSGRNRAATRAVIRVAAFREPGLPWQVIGSGVEARLHHPGFVDLVAGREYLAQGRIWPPHHPPEALNPAWPKARDFTFAITQKTVPQRLSDGPPGAVFDRVRQVLSRRVLGSIDGPVGDLVLALMVGEGGGIDPLLRSDLSALGTAHILAVSGLHVAAVGAIVGLLLARIAGPFIFRCCPGANLARVRRWLCTASAVGVALLAGMTPSAGRAAGMFAMATLAIEAGRRQPLEGIIAITGLMTLLIQPKQAFSLSFVLSYGAVIGMALLTPRLTPAWARRSNQALGSHGWRQRLLRGITMGLCASVAASLGTLPATLLAFGVIAPLAPLANLVVVPLTTFLVMPLILIILLIAVVWPAALPVLGRGITPVLAAFLEAQSGLSRSLPDLGLTAGTWTVVGILSIWVVVITRLLVGQLPLHGWGLTVLVAVLAFAIVLNPARRPTRPEGLQVVFLAAGKGDAILIDCPNGQRWMVDTGREVDATRVNGTLARLREHGVAHLDGVVLTHPDEDHSGGVVTLTRAIEIDEVVTTCPTLFDPRFATTLNRLHQRGISIRCVWAGAMLGDSCGDGIEVLWPLPDATSSGNDQSLVVRIAHQGVRMLLTGDLEADGEAAMIEHGIDLQASAMKLGHHGSPGASSAPFLAKVAPEIVVVSGYPTRSNAPTHHDILARVGQIGARLLSTESCGDTVFTLSRSGIWAVGEDSSGRRPRMACGFQQVFDEVMR